MTPTRSPFDGRIEGYVFEDTDGDRERDSDEPGIAGVWLVLSDGRRTHSYEGGWYGFIEVPAGSYRLAELQPMEYISTTPDEVAIALEVAEVSWGHDFGDRHFPDTPTPTLASTEPPAPTASPTETFTPAELPLIRLNEILPRPNGVDWDGDGTSDASDEWIEITNLDTETVDLRGWILDDIAGGGSRPYVFPAGVALGPGEFLVAFRSATGVMLNNDADTVRLIAPDGVEVDQFGYENPSSDASYSRSLDGTGAWTADFPPSPGQPNRPGIATLTPTVTVTRTPPPTATPTRTRIATRTATVTASPTRTPLITASQTSTPVPYEELRVRLSEFLAYPAEIDWNGDGQVDGDDEWVEVWNDGTTGVDLSSWVIDDVAGSGSRPYIISDGLPLSPGGYRVYFHSQTGVTLNNDGDTVRLLGPDGAVVDAMTYVRARPDHSYSRIAGDDVSWSEEYPPSPGGPNLPATATPTPTPTPTSTTYPQGVLLNEILPDPKSVDWDHDGRASYEDEWIELFNSEEKPADLGGWTVRDDGHSYRLPAASVIGPRTWLLLFRAQTGLALGNAKDRVTLLRPDGVVVDEFEYSEGPGDDRSYCRIIDGGGLWMRDCLTTPGNANGLLPPPPTPSAAPPPVGGSGARSGSKTAAANAQSVGSIAAARAAEPGISVALSGTVTMPPGLFGRSIYLQDRGAGIRVALRKGDYPPLRMGDLVRVRGKTEDYHGDLQVAVAEPDQIEILGAGAPPALLLVATGIVGEAQEGRLLWVFGRIVELESGALVLDDGSGPLRVYFPEDLPWRRPRVKVGETWAAQGIVSQYVRQKPYIGGYRLIPRLVTDIAPPPAILPVTGGPLNQSITTAAEQGGMTIPLAVSSQVGSSTSR